MQYESPPSSVQGRVSKETRSGQEVEWEGERAGYTSEFMRCLTVNQTGDHAE